MFRVRATSFFTGFAVASGIAMFQLQRDVWGSHNILADEVRVTPSYYDSIIAYVFNAKIGKWLESPSYRSRGITRNWRNGYNSLSVQVVVLPLLLYLTRRALKNAVDA